MLRQLKTQYWGVGRYSKCKPCRLDICKMVEKTCENRKLKEITN